MILDHFQRFTQLLQSGKRSDAAVAIRAFVDSFSSLEEKRVWSEEYLTAHGHGKNIRHELYEEVIFPVLLEGYRRSDPWSLRWLAKTNQNLYRATRLWRQMEWKSEAEFLEELLALCPDDEEARVELLSCYVERLRFAVHEWPAGIFFGMNGATLEECNQIAEELEKARQLDRENLYANFLADFAIKLEEYSRRLVVRSAESHDCGR